MKNNIQTTINTHHQCISCMKEYENKSLEELRYEDYLAGRKGPGPGAGVQTGGLFGASSTAQTGSFFGQTQQKPLFGTPSTSKILLLATVNPSGNVIVIFFRLIQVSGKRLAYSDSLSSSRLHLRSALNRSLLGSRLHQHSRLLALVRRLPNSNKRRYSVSHSKPNRSGPLRFLVPLPRVSPQLALALNRLLLAPSDLAHSRHVFHCLLLGKSLYVLFFITLNLHTTDTEPFWRGETSLWSSNYSIRFRIWYPSDDNDNDFGWVKYFRRETCHWLRGNPDTCFRCYSCPNNHAGFWWIW